MLETLAITHGHEGETVASVLDAGRGELYVGEYEVRDNRARLVRQSIEKLNDFLTRLPAKSKLITTFAKLVESSVTLVDPLQVDAIGRIGLRKLLAGDVVDSATLDANYIRRSDAELFSQPKR